jgi:drug/metabolite transporter (DMT)-like permease
VTTPSGRITPFALFLIVGLGFAWGCNWLMIRIAVLEVPPWTYRWSTCGLGGLILLAIEIMRGGAIWPERGEWRRLAILSIFNVTVWQMAVAFAVLFMGTGRGAVLAFTMPVWTALLSVLFLGERLTRRTMITLTLASVGIVLLLLRDLAAVGDSPLGVSMALSAAIGWAIAVLYQKRNSFTVGVFAFAGWQQILGVVPIIAAALVIEPIVPPMPSGAAWLAMSYSVLAGFVFAYSAWFTLVRILPTHVASISALLVPTISIATGALALAEPFGWREAAALALISTAMALVLLVPQRQAHRS